MSKRITISSFKSLPGALILALALTVLAEGALYSTRPELVKDFWNKFIINERVLLEMPGDNDYLIIGDSIQKTGINPSEAGSGLLNIGLPGGKPMAMYLLFERYLKHHRPPKTVFLYVDPEDPQDSTNVILRYFVKINEFLSVWKDLTWEERRIFMMRYWASLDLRKVSLTRRDEYDRPNSDFISGLKAGRGYMPSPRADKAISDDYFDTHTARYAMKVSFSGNDRKYLDKFMSLAASLKIKVVFLGFLEPKGLYKVLTRTGFNGDYIEFYKGLKARYPDAYFSKRPILRLDNKYFADPSHVNKEGSGLFTRYFKDEVFEPSVLPKGEVR